MGNSGVIMEPNYLMVLAYLIPVLDTVAYRLPDTMSASAQISELGAEYAARSPEANSPPGTESQ